MMMRLRDLLAAVSFHRGLAIGALVGSAIAGSTIWARIREKRETAAAAEEQAGSPGSARASTAPTNGATTATD